MKKTMIMTLVAMMAMTANAQREEMTPEQREARRVEMVQKQGERLAKQMKLDNNAKNTFIATYTEYRNELNALNPDGEIKQQPEAHGVQKEYTEEQAKAKLKEIVEKQQKEIEKSTKRLEITQKYMAIFEKSLTAQQLIKVFTLQQRNQFGRQNGQGGQRQGNFGGQRPGGFGGQRPGGFGGQMPGGFGGGDF